MKTQLKCFGCNHEISFGQQRCTNCGVLIYWQGKGDEPKVPVLRTTPLTFPQKAMMIASAFGRSQPDESSEVVREYFAQERVVAIGMAGDYVALEHGGWIHYSKIALFGRLILLTVVDPKGGTSPINVLDRPIWGTTPEECGSTIKTVKPGELVEVWEVVPGWFRIFAGTGWLPTHWFDPVAVKKIS